MLLVAMDVRVLGTDVMHRIRASGDWTGCGRGRSGAFWAGAVLIDLLLTAIPVDMYDQLGQSSTPSNSLATWEWGGMGQKCLKTSDSDQDMALAGFMTQVDRKGRHRHGYEDLGNPGAVPMRRLTGSH
jgi:hypothetical protein